MRVNDNRGIPGTFWAEKDAYTENERWDEGGTKLKSPGRNDSYILDNNVGAESCTSLRVSAPKLIDVKVHISYDSLTQEDADDDPKLPEHHKSTSDPSGSHLSGIDGDSGVFGANSDTHDKTSGEESLP